MYNNNILIEKDIKSITSYLKINAKLKLIF